MRLHRKQSRPKPCIVINVSIVMTSCLLLLKTIIVIVIVISANVASFVGIVAVSTTTVIVAMTCLNNSGRWSAEATGSVAQVLSAKATALRVALKVETDSECYKHTRNMYQYMFLMYVCK